MSPTYEYRDAGLVGDAVVRDWSAGSATHLEPGGVALLIGNWEVRAGETWRDVWASWLDGDRPRRVGGPARRAGPCRVRRALGRGRRRQRSGTPGYEDLYAAWLADFADRGVERVGFGVVALQRPDRGPPTPGRTSSTIADPVAGAMGPAVDAALAARTWLAEHGDDALLDVSLVLRPGRHRGAARAGRAPPTRRSSSSGRAADWAGRSRSTPWAPDWWGSVTGASPRGRRSAPSRRCSTGRKPPSPPSVLPLLRDLVADGLLI